MNKTKREQPQQQAEASTSQMITGEQIYLDYMATCPLDDRVREAMLALGVQVGAKSGSGRAATARLIGNANAMHQFGNASRQAIEQARAQVAQLIHCTPQAITWTSGATEANNLAIYGIARFYQRNGRHLITSWLEHPSVLECFKQLATQGFRVDYLEPNAQGVVSVEQLKQLLDSETILVSVAAASSEWGSLQPVAQLAAEAHRVGALFHSDMAQLPGRVLPEFYDMQQLNLDAATFSAHKLYGPIGVGALYLRQQPKLHLAPLFYGGSQEDGIRPGSLPAPLIVGMGKACELLQQEDRSQLAYLQQLTEAFMRTLSQLTAVVPLDQQVYPLDVTKQQLQSRVIINGGAPKLPNLINLTVLGLEPARGLLELLPKIAASYSSACHWDCRSQQPPVSQALLHLGVPETLLRHTIRLSWGRYTTVEEVEQTAQLISRLVTKR